jgi:hypothetical protein
VTPDKGTAAPGLDSIDIREALRVNNELLLLEMQTRMLAVVTEENARTQRLDQKAGALLSAVALTATVGGALSARSGGMAAWWFLVPAICALAATGFSLWVLRVQSHRRVDESDLLAARTLEAEAKDEKDAVHRYMRKNLGGIWRAYAHTCNINDRRARSVFYGQVAFGAAILTFMGATTITRAMAPSKNGT